MFESQDRVKAPIGKGRFSEGVTKKVMRGARSHSVHFFANLRCAVLSLEFDNILIELHGAISARGIYESAIELPIDDLFFVGGQLQGIIRRAERALDQFNRGQIYRDAYVKTILQSRLQEAKDFRKYIVKRIRTDFAV